MEDGWEEKWGLLGGTLDKRRTENKATMTEGARL